MLKVLQSLPDQCEWVFVQVAMTKNCIYAYAHCIPSLYNIICHCCICCHSIEIYCTEVVHSFTSQLTVAPIYVLMPLHIHYITLLKIRNSVGVAGDAPLTFLDIKYALFNKEPKILVIT